MQDERPIEKLLRAFANKRRADAGPPLEMHPATRRMLLGEVARQYRQNATSAGPSPFWRSLWPRLAWALPVLTVLAVGFWAMVHSPRQPGKDMSLAQSTDVPRDSTGAPAPLAVPAPNANETRPPGDAEQPALFYAEKSPSAPPGVGSKLELAKGTKETDSVRSEEQSAARDFQSRRTLAPEPTIPAGRDTAPSRALPTEARTDSLKTAVGPDQAGGGVDRSAAQAPVVAVAPLPVAVPTSAPGDFATDSTSKALAPRAPTWVQSFVQTPATADRGVPFKRASDASQVLTGFQLEQTGNQLRVVDSDGSSYTGLISTVVPVADSFRQPGPAGAAAEARLRTAPATPPFGGGGSGQFPAGQNVAFRVMGTNRTLRQQVIFEGNLKLPTNVTAAAQSISSDARMPAGQTAEQLQIPQVLLQNSTISGRVRLGANQEVQINAVPVTR